VRLDQTNVRLDQTNVRLDQTNARLEAVEGQLGQVRQGLADLGGFMRDLALSQARHERFHAQHVEVLEKDVAALKARLDAVEKRLGEQ
jgi:hypothetical protein